MPTLSLALVFAAKCATGSLQAGEAELSAARPIAVLAVDPGHRGRTILDVARVSNPRSRGIAILAKDDGTRADEQRFSLYPPDAPAKFAFRLSEDARKVTITLVEPMKDDGVGLTVRLEAR